MMCCFFMVLPQCSVDFVTTVVTTCRTVYALKRPEGPKCATIWAHFFIRHQPPHRARGLRARLNKVACCRIRSLEGGFLGGTLPAFIDSAGRPWHTSNGGIEGIKLFDPHPLRLVALVASSEADRVFVDALLHPWACGQRRSNAAFHRARVSGSQGVAQRWMAVRGAGHAASGQVQFQRGRRARQPCGCAGAGLLGDCDRNARR